MKGIVFTEFLEMVEDTFGFDVADKIVSDEQLPSGGIYTAVGTYPYAELVTLVTNLSTETNTEIPQLLHAYGKHLFTVFAKGYGVFFEEAKNAFDFLAGIENYIHVEVRKLYPDAELPTFDIHQPNPQTLEMLYYSERGMADFAEGLIEGCISHYEETIDLHREDLAANYSKARFTLVRNEK